MGLGREPMADPEDYASYRPGQYWASNWHRMTGCFMAPMDSRCVAAPSGNSDYIFCRSGGSSWAVPWVAGVYALACQVEPDMTPELFWETVAETSRDATFEVGGRTEKFGRFIDPAALIGALR